MPIYCKKCKVMRKAVKNGGGATQLYKFPKCGHQKRTSKRK